MIWVLLGALALAALAPLALALLGPARARGRREADLALYRAQLAELDRERDLGRLDEAAHRAATVEVQRRLLAAPEEQAPAARGGRSLALLATLLAIPAAAAGLYLWRGVPDMPSAPFAERAEAANRDDALIAELRARVATLEPGSEPAWQGLALLGNAERSRGRGEAAAAAWRRALEIRFHPDLAADLAELEIERGEHEAAARLLVRAIGAVGAPSPRLRFLAGLAEARAGRPENARAAWRALLAEAPPDAPWRPIVELQLNALP
jgi:cytochrome c-type biogenesis protein CcmH